MEGINLETILQVVTILGGIIALFLALLQIVETYVDIGDKLHNRRLERKSQTPGLPNKNNCRLFDTNKSNVLVHRVGEGACHGEDVAPRPIIIRVSTRHYAQAPLAPVANWPGRANPPTAPPYRPPADASPDVAPSTATPRPAYHGSTP